MEGKTMKTKTLTISMSFLLVSTVLLGFMGAVSAAPPNTPNKPAGPINASHHVLLNYTTNPVFAESNHWVEYNFSWGDGTYTGWFGPFKSGKGPVYAKHQWTGVGVYQVKVKARDFNATTQVTPFSLPLNVTIALLETPGQPIGETIVDVNELCLFSVKSVTAAYNHDVYYLFNWSDNFTTGWFGPYPSAFQFPVEAEHNWDKKGIYPVRVKAKDKTSGDESAWSKPWNITIGTAGPLFEVSGVKGGLGVTATIKNLLAPSKYVDYVIEVSGGPLTGLHTHKYFNGTVFIKSGASVSISTGSFFGLGNAKISVVAKCAGQPVASANYGAFVLFFYVMNVKKA